MPTTTSIFSTSHYYAVMSRQLTVAASADGRWWFMHECTRQTCLKLAGRYVTFRENPPYSSEYPPHVWWRGGMAPWLHYSHRGVCSRLPHTTTTVWSLAASVCTLVSQDGAAGGAHHLTLVREQTTDPSLSYYFGVASVDLRCRQQQQLLLLLL